MKLWIHYRMASMICSRLDRKGIRLNRFMFILGNMTPDVDGSFFFRRHEYGSSAGFVKKSIRRLWDDRIVPSAPGFSYALGIISHYICDYFCYAHSPSFQGNLLDHIKYEVTQIFSAGGAVSLSGSEGPVLDLPELMDTLERYIFNHDKDLLRDAAFAIDDVSWGVAVCEWLIEMLFSRRSASSLGRPLRFRKRKHRPPVAGRTLSSGFYILEI